MKLYCMMPTLQLCWFGEIAQLMSFQKFKFDPFFRRITDSEINLCQNTEVAKQLYPLTVLPKLVLL